MQKRTAFHDPLSRHIPYGERNSTQKIWRNYLKPSNGKKNSYPGRDFLLEHGPPNGNADSYEPYIGEEELEQLSRHEREIRDHLDELEFKDKLEEAKWRQLVARETLFDNRISRLLSYALNNYKVALNPQLIRNALEKYARMDTSIDPTKHRKLTVLSRSTLTPIEEVEDVIVDDIMKQRIEYMEDILDDSKPLTIIWDSAPIPDVELIIKAGEKGLLPVKMVGKIISNEMGIEDVYENEIQQQEHRDKEIEDFLKRNKEKLGISIGTGRAAITSAMATKKKNNSKKRKSAEKERPEKKKKKKSSDGSKTKSSSKEKPADKG
jgi:hypothetical protein